MKKLDEDYTKASSLLHKTILNTIMEVQKKMGKNMGKQQECIRNFQAIQMWTSKLDIFTIV